MNLEKGKVNGVTCLNGSIQLIGIIIVIISIIFFINNISTKK